MTDRALFVVAVPLVAFAVGMQYGRGELGGLSAPAPTMRTPANDSQPSLLMGEPAQTGDTRSSAPVGGGAPNKIEGIGVQGWHDRAVANRRTINRLRRVVLTDGNVTEALNLAATVYGYSLWSKARCETGGTFDPHARNLSSGAAGLLQFLPSTWASTPYAGFSVWSPYANALAAGWMHARGRGGEWQCR